jgi:hypothetical protein
MRKPPTAGGGEKSFAAYMARGKEQAVDNFVDSWLSQVDWSHLNPLAVSTMVDVTECPPSLFLPLRAADLRALRGACCTGVGCSTARGDGGALYAADSAGTDATAAAASLDDSDSAAGHDAAASHADADPAAAAAGGHDAAAAAAAGHDSARLRCIQCTVDDRPVRAARRVLCGLLCSTYISSKCLKCGRDSYQYMLALVGAVMRNALMFTLNSI